jgi:putative toxin-antitoxin system antitoxin component (TIGR02293 family)
MLSSLHNEVGLDASRYSEYRNQEKCLKSCWWLIFALVLPFGYNEKTKWRFAMKTFSLSSTPARPQRLWQVAGLNNADGVALLGQINEGLDGKVANRITDWARITQNDLRKMSGIPSTTFSRSVKARFNPEQSERLVRIIRVIDRAVDLFEGDREAAQKWLNEPNRALSWKVPADLMASETGAYEVIKLITRLEHGVYS